jgi:hypothetical protein
MAEALEQHVFAHLAGPVETKTAAETTRVAKFSEECLALQFRQCFIQIRKFRQCRATRECDG